MGDLIVAGIPASVVIVTLVEALKKAGLARKYAPLAAIACGIALMLAVQAARVAPGLRVWWEAIGSGLLLGLTACGMYSGAKSMIVRQGGGGGKYLELPSGDVVEK